jgi:hypothetical protein
MRTASTLDTSQAQATDLELAASFELSHATATAESLLKEAMGFCAQKIGVASREALADLLRQNDRMACEYCLYDIAKRVAVCLGTMDEHVRAVYVLDYDATPPDGCFDTLTLETPFVHLIVWTGRKTAALRSLATALDRALAQAYADLIGRPQLKCLLDVQMIDDVDVEMRTGQGALLQAIHHRPIQVWER